MKTLNTVVTNLGVALIAAATPESPIVITKVVFAQAAASPVTNQVVPGSPSANALILPVFEDVATAFAARSFSGKFIGVRGTIPKHDLTAWILQAGIYSGENLIAIGAFPAHQRTPVTDEVDYTVMMLVPDLNKFALDQSTLALSTRASAIAKKGIKEAALESRFPTGKIGETIQGSVGVKKTHRLVMFAGFAHTAAELSKALQWVTDNPTKVDANYCLYYPETLRMWKFTGSTFSEFTHGQTTAGAMVNKPDQIFHDKRTCRSYFVGATTVERIFCAPE